jgi:hypothetical protein
LALIYFHLESILYAHSIDDIKDDDIDKIKKEDYVNFLLPATNWNNNLCSFYQVYRLYHKYTLLQVLLILENTLGVLIVVENLDYSFLPVYC